LFIVILNYNKINLLFDNQYINLQFSNHGSLIAAYTQSGLLLGEIDSKLSQYLF